jgi:hypothetical protein
MDMVPRKDQLASLAPGLAALARWERQIKAEVEASGGRRIVDVVRFTFGGKYITFRAWTEIDGRPSPETTGVVHETAAVWERARHYVGEWLSFEGLSIGEEYKDLKQLLIRRDRYDQGKRVLGMVLEAEVDKTGYSLAGERIKSAEFVGKEVPRKLAELVDVCMAGDWRAAESFQQELF